jgi:hypothetical protein
MKRIYIKQDSGGDLEWFAWEFDGQRHRIVSSFHETREDAERAAERYTQQQGAKGKADG